MLRETAVAAEGKGEEPMGELVPVEEGAVELGRDHHGPVVAEGMGEPVSFAVTSRE